MSEPFYTSLPVILYARLRLTPPLDWNEVDQGPGWITLPEGCEYGFRIHNIDNAELKLLVNELASVTPLTYVNLSENRKITNPGLAALQAFPQVETLNLSSCSLTNDGILHLQGLRHLKSLDISYCNRLTGPGLKNLEPLRNLTQLNLQGCIKITNGDVARFKKRGLEIKK